MKLQEGNVFSRVCHLLRGPMSNVQGRSSAGSLYSEIQCILSNGHMETLSPEQMTSVYFLDQMAS